MFEEGLKFFNSQKLVLLDYGTGNVSKPEEWSRTSQYVPFHMFYFLIKGKFEIFSTSTNCKTEIIPNHAYLIPTGIYDLTCIEPSIVFATHFFCLSKTGRDLLEDYYGNIYDLGIYRDNYALSNILTCFNNGQIKEADIFLFKGFLHQIIGEVLKENSSNTSFSFHKQPSALTVQITSYIEQHLSAQLKIQDIATIFNYHPNYLSKRFFIENGITLKRYIETQLYQKSLFLLSVSNKPLHNIAQELCFSSSYYFSKFFKKLHGCSPENFRKTQGSLRPVQKTE